MPKISFSESAGAQSESDPRANDARWFVAQQKLVFLVVDEKLSLHSLTGVRKLQVLKSHIATVRRCPKTGAVTTREPKR
jgi:hypothetical protein